MPFDPIRALLPLQRAARLKPKIGKSIGQLGREAQETELDMSIELRRVFDAQKPPGTDRETKR